MKVKKVFQLIGERYLDTQFDNDYLENLDNQLKSLYIVGPIRLLFEYIAASALWWNILCWEWAFLTLFDVLYGWALNIILFGVIWVISALLFNMLVASVFVIILHIFTLVLAYRMRIKKT